jgi:hypothetical protein
MTALVIPAEAEPRAQTSRRKRLLLDQVPDRACGASGMTREWRAA